MRIVRFILHTRPKVEYELQRWKNLANQMPDRALQEQALNSLTLKRFHALGGSFYAIWYPRWESTLVPLIVAIQTISDYLDNLCDRMQLTDSSAFRTLHLAFMDALDPGEPIKDYYHQYPCQEDGGYLANLVAYSQQLVRLLPSFSVVQDSILDLASLYCDLQVYKHMDLSTRESILQNWAESQGINFSDLKWWEFSAATGSTLAIFALLAAATRPELETKEVEQILKAYFPWICGLHILLDYYIDQEEDRLGGDLNFISYYPNPTTAEERIGCFLQKAIENVRNLPNADFHTMVVKGLPALYLSDPKVNQQDLTITAYRLLAQAGRGTKNLFQICRTLRSLKLV